MSDEVYTLTDAELDAEIRYLSAEGATVLAAGFGEELDREEFLTEFDRWLSEVKRAAAEAAWDKGCDAFEAAHKQDHLEPWPHLGENPFRERGEGE